MTKATTSKSPQVRYYKEALEELHEGRRTRREHHLDLRATKTAGSTSACASSGTQFGKTLMT
jgi:hypothetical protein